MLRKTVIAVALLLASSVCYAAPTMKPGLWRINSKLQADSNVGQEMAMAQRQLAQLPPEQRQMMEAMMAQRGIGFGAGGPGSFDSQVCVSKEMAARNEVPSAKAGCRQSVTSSSGNTMKISFTCSSPPSSGEGQITFASREAYTMTMVVTSAANGHEQKTNMTTNGQWLSADCGNVKPGSGTR